MNCDDDNYNLAAKNIAAFAIDSGNISGGKSVKSMFYIRINGEKRVAQF